MDYAFQCVQVVSHYYLFHSRGTVLPLRASPLQHYAKKNNRLTLGIGRNDNVTFVREGSSTWCSWCTSHSLERETHTHTHTYIYIYIYMSFYLKIPYFSFSPFSIFHLLIFSSSLVLSLSLSLLFLLVSLSHCLVVSPPYA